MDAVGRLPRSVATMRGGASFVLALVLAGCGSASYTPPPPPSEEEAAEYLRTVVEIVTSGDLTTLCRLGSGTCQHTLQGVDPAAVPRSGPTVIGTRVIAPTRSADGTWIVGGRVLELCGRDGRNRPYYSEMLVFRDGDRLISTVPIYWLGIRIASGPDVGSPAPPPASCP